MSLYRRKDSKYWWVSVMVKGRKLAVSSRSTDKMIARQIEMALLERLHGMTVDRFNEVIARFLEKDEQRKDVMKNALLSNLAETVEDFLADEGSTITARTLRDRKNVCNRFVEWCQATKQEAVLISDVNVELAWRFVGSIDSTAKTKQNVVGELSAAWASLQRRGVTKENPWKVARPKKNRLEEKTGRAFTSGEVKRILDACEAPWLHRAIMIALYTGLRKGDVLALEWGHIIGNTIDVMPSKTSRFKTRVVIPIHPRLKEYLNALPRESIRIVGETPSHTDRKFSELLRKVGIVAVGDEKLSFHCLRHTFATWLRDAGADKGEQMKLGGWTNLATSNRYDHATERLREIVNELPSI